MPYSTEDSEEAYSGVIPKKSQSITTTDSISPNFAQISVLPPGTHRVNSWGVRRTVTVAVCHVVYGVNDSSKTLFWPSPSDIFQFKLSSHWRSWISVTEQGIKQIRNVR